MILKPLENAIEGSSTRNVIAVPFIIILIIKNIHSSTQLTSLGIFEWETGEMENVKYFFMIILDIEHPPSQPIINVCSPYFLLLLSNYLLLHLSSRDK